jgi:hypothetical protein
VNVQLHDPAALTPKKRAYRTYRIGGRVDRRAGLDDMEKRRLLTLTGLELRTIGQPARSQSLYRLRYPSCSVWKWDYCDVSLKRRVAERNWLALNRQSRSNTDSVVFGSRFHGRVRKFRISVNSLKPSGYYYVPPAAVHWNSAFCSHSVHVCTSTCRTGLTIHSDCFFKLTDWVL